MRVKSREYLYVRQADVELQYTLQTSSRTDMKITLRMQCVEDCEDNTLLHEREGICWATSFWLNARTLFQRHAPDATRPTQYPVLMVASRCCGT